MSKVLRIMLKKSIIGRTKKHRVVVDSLGLRKINQEVQVKDTPQIRGMIKKVSYLLDVEDISPENEQKSIVTGKEQA